MKDWVLDILSGPGGQGELTLERAVRVDGAIVSADLIDVQGRRFPVIDGIPHFIPKAEAESSDGIHYEASTDVRAKWKNQIRRYPRLTRMAQWLFDPAVVDQSSRDDLLRKLPPSARVLNVGSGVLDVPGIECINLDLEAYGNVNVVADGQQLPFKGGVFDLVILEYVIEHVPDSTLFKSELERVLKPGGLIYATVPFMQAYHGNPDDYYRFTVSGFRKFWSAYECVECKPFGGPTSALVCVLKEWLAIVLSFGNKTIYGLLSQLLIIPFFPLKYIDLLLKTQNDHNIAFSLLFIGRKPSPDGGALDLQAPPPSLPAAPGHTHDGAASKDETGTSLPTLLLISGICLFWMLRAFYWDITFEPMFSDMVMYENMARNIIANFDFSYTPYYKMLMVPTMPTLRALQSWVSGDSYLHWRIFQTCVLFIGMLWLAYEMCRLTWSRWVGLALVWLVALSAPSIFWSYKLTKESLGEAFTYMLVANTLFALRRPSLGAFFALGVLQAVAIFNRPNFALIAAIFAVTFLWTAIRHAAVTAPGWRAGLRQPVRLFAAFCVGGLLVWAPWGYRAYTIMGTPFVLSTEAPWVFLAAAPLEVTLNDGAVVREKDTLQRLLPSMYPTEREAQPFLKKVVADWWTIHRADMPAIAARNLQTAFLEQFEWLSHVSRTDLFPPGLNAVIIDKTGLILLTGICGLFILAFLFPHGYLFPLFALTPAVTGALLAGIPRMVDPSIPLILFGNVGWVLVAARSQWGRRVFPVLPRRRWLAAVPVALVPLALGQIVSYRPPALALPPLANPSFEDWANGEKPPSGWEFGGDGVGRLSKMESGAPDQTLAARIASTRGTVALYQDFPDARAFAGQSVELSALVRNAAPGAVRVNLVANGGLEIAAKNTSVAGEWERVAVSAQMPHKVEKLRLHIWLLKNGEAEVDAVDLKVKPAS